MILVIETMKNILRQACFQEFSCSCQKSVKKDLMLVAPPPVEAEVLRRGAREPAPPLHRREVGAPGFVVLAGHHDGAAGGLKERWNQITTNSNKKSKRKKNRGVKGRKKERSNREE